MLRTPSIHRLRRGLPGYLILFDPRAFAQLASVHRQVGAFASGVPPDLYVFRYSTRNSPTLSGTQDQPFRLQFPGLAQGFHNRLADPPMSALRPVIPNNARTPRITAAAGTQLAGPSSSGTVESYGY